MDNYTTRVNSIPADWAALNAALNIFLAITATLGNILILIALHKVSSMHPPTKLLFRCLAFTDLCVGLTVQPLFIIIELNYGAKLNLNSLSHVSHVLCGVSTFTSTALGVDRLLALKLELRYRHIVTLRRVRCLVICFWLGGVCGAFMYTFWSYIASITISAVVLLLSLIISLSYTNIFLKLQQHQAQVQQHTYNEQPNGGGVPLNIARYKKTVYSVVYFQLALAVCYVPYIILVIIVHLNEFRSIGWRIAWSYGITLLLFNSSLNPILYLWRINEVRHAVKDTVKRYCFPSS